MEQNRHMWPGWVTGKAIGKGGFGRVYEIYREEFGFRERAALKVISIPQSEDEVDLLRGEGLDDDSITTQFSGHVNDIIQEYKLMMGLKNCPNIVHCEDYMVVKFQEGLGWDVYLKMELLTPLLKALDQVSSEQQILKFALDLTNALVVCQKKNILHRDIKPQNIFVDDEGTFKLGDFGIARTMERTTRATVGIGTYNFMAPEVLSGQPYGPSADVYSLGLVLYWLLNQRRGPFLPLPPQSYTSLDDERARRRRFDGEPLPPPVSGSPALQRIVLKACAFDPGKRYPNALLLRSDLEKLCRQAPVREENATVLPVRQPKPSGRRSKWLLPAAAAGALVIGIFLGTRFTGGSQEAPPPAATEAPVSLATITVEPDAISQTQPAAVTEQTVPPTVPSTVPSTVPPAPVRTWTAIDGGTDHTVVLYSDGTVSAVGANFKGQCDVGGWTDIIRISTLTDHTVGLRADGTVVATGDNTYGQCNVEDWSNIVAVSAGARHTVGVRADGTVVAVGDNTYGQCDVTGWSGVTDVGCALSNTFGLCADGTVYVSGTFAKGKLHGWEGIIQISVSDAHIVGVKLDGTVKAVGSNSHGQCDLEEWNSIVQVSAGCAYTTGLRSNGTIVVQGIDDEGQHQARQWNGICYIATGMEHTIGVTGSGSFLAVGSNDSGQCNVYSIQP